MAKRVGVTAMFNLSSGGGIKRVTVDLINTLNELGREVYLLTPFKPDYKKIRELYGNMKVNKVYYLPKWKQRFCKGELFSRILMKNDFIKMSKEVDFIIDLDGGVFHKYLPKDFNKNNYIVWRLCCTKPQETDWTRKNLWKKLKNKVRVYLSKNKENRPSINYKLYAIDKWTSDELIKYWNLKPEEMCLYPPIQVKELLYKGQKKKNQIVIFGRLAPEKRIEESIRVFAKGTKAFPEYNLVIFGATTVDSKRYISYLRKLIKELGIDNRTKIIISPPFRELKKLLLESRIIIDSENDISLTITSLEAMAAGNLVLTSKNSGNYIDVLDNGKYGYGFDNVEDGAEKLDEILRNIKKIDTKKSIKRTEFFSQENFKRRLIKIINGSRYL